MKIYVVTYGTYSDYTIEAVFTDKVKAEEFVADFNRAARYDEAEIEEYEADQPIVIKFATDVEMDKQGNVLSTILIFNPPLKSMGFGWFHPAYKFMNTDRPDRFTWRVATDDITRAVKVVNEKRTIILAQNLWMDNEGARKLFSSFHKEETKEGKTE